MAQKTSAVSGDLDLTMDEPRVPARYVVRRAADVLSVVEWVVPSDGQSPGHPAASRADECVRERE
ncbi:hypothetical protein [Halostreptopolyspora alba]|uniref:Uncharacterized protein n=1 Tax=Halostreptopolyspora alba TaxID=2487137 RepID=A0A3N0E6Z7_9ACTN|nr:hypothetical protein EFW17_15240 [Nocardiopsaceae bacterium YIM 96095]